jgi:hypothetical protein
MIWPFGTPAEQFADFNECSSLTPLIHLRWSYLRPEDRVNSTMLVHLSVSDLEAMLAKQLGLKSGSSMPQLTR